ncbi:ribosome production factor 2 homolog [Trichonephila inaurata madagascariensis]|uniref:Ribosome production factor 2 homolog n=1 Tax=Trichonephila inaurata madagascariensis TaxID=2747483 RepID=A0A8X6MDG6_9ARAC|nr:ribosome production factor 2 homolog [Trichonephila inaurata madagascariensis]
MSNLIQKPKTRKGKRILQKREPKLIENDKVTLFLRGKNANNVVLTAMKDFFQYSVNIFFPLCLYHRKNDMAPFEDASPLEFYGTKKDASLFMFGSHNKKRPNNLVAGRLFNHQILDMFEFGIEEFKPMKDFKVSKIAKGNKPMLLFTDGFDETNDTKRLKNFFIDFFRGPVIEKIYLKGLEHLLVFSLVNKKILFRSYRVDMKKDADSKTPLVELTEIGPHMNLTVRRTNLADDDLFKTSCQKPKQLKPTKVKNISKDTFGSTLGRIHMERQDYRKLQIRKLKGLKKKKLGSINKKGKSSPKKIRTEPEETKSSEPPPKKIKMVPEEA